MGLVKVFLGVPQVSKPVLENSACSNHGRVGLQNPGTQGYTPKPGTKGYLDFAWRKPAFGPNQSDHFAGTFGSRWRERGC